MPSNILNPSMCSSTLAPYFIDIMFENAVPIINERNNAFLKILRSKKSMPGNAQNSPDSMNFKLELYLPVSTTQNR